MKYPKRSQYKHAKSRYRIRNWSAYEAGLQKRGDLTVWLSAELLHFVIDRHPRWENVWLAGGGTGHAFKHGPVLGDYIAARVLGEETDPELDGLFAL